MNAAITFVDRGNGNQRHTVKLLSVQNLGSVVRGYQKVRKGFLRRTIGAQEIVEIRDLPKTKLRDVMNVTPVRVMFYNGSISTYSKIERHLFRKTLLSCTPVDEGGDNMEPQVIEASCPITILFD